MTISLMLVAEDEINKPGATFKLLEQRVTALEKENDQLKMRISILEEKKVLQPKELADILPKEEKEKKSFSRSFRRELRKAMPPGQAVPGPVQIPGL